MNDPLETYLLSDLVRQQVGILDQRSDKHGDVFAYDFVALLFGEPTSFFGQTRELFMVLIEPFLHFLAIPADIYRNVEFFWSRKKLVSKLEL